MRNAVNFPDVEMARESPYRVAIANANVPEHAGPDLALRWRRRGLNIHNMLNKSQGRDGVHAGRRRQRGAATKCSRARAHQRRALGALPSGASRMSDELEKLRDATSTRVDDELARGCSSQRAALARDDRHAQGRRARPIAPSARRRSCGASRGRESAARCRRERWPRVFREIMSACRALEQAHHASRTSGPQGTFSEQAVLKHFGARGRGARLRLDRRGVPRGRVRRRGVRGACRWRTPPRARSAARSTSCSPRRCGSAASRCCASTST